MNLSLLAPIGLVAAISLGIVVLLHVRRQTPPPLDFPSLRFWTSGVAAESERQRFRLPPITLPLLLQLLIALLVTLALARPVISGAWSGLTGRTTPEHLVILLDGSTSMLAHNTGEQRSRFERGRQETLSLLDDWQTGDVATVMLLGATPDTQSASNRQQLDELKSWIRQVSPPGGQTDLDTALRLARNLVLPDRMNRIELVTDAVLTADPEIAKTIPMPVHVNNVGQNAPTANAAITSMTAQPIAGVADQYAITLTISNFGNEDADIPWHVDADDTSVAKNTAFLAPGGSQSITVNLPVGARQSQAAIDYSDALYTDNFATVPLSGDRLGQLDILLISDAPSSLLRALQALPGAHVDLHPSSIPGLHDLSAAYDLTVIENGVVSLDDLPVTPMLLVQPQTLDGQFTISGTLGVPIIASLAPGDPVLHNVDLSGVTFGETPYYTVPDNARTLVSGSGNDMNGPLIWAGDIAGNAYVSFAFSIDESNIAQRVAFPILINSVVDSLTTSALPRSIPAGKVITFTPEPETSRLQVTLPDESHRTITVTTGEDGLLPAVIDFTGAAGVYTVTSLRADGSALAEGTFVVNAGDPQESDLTINPDLQSTLDLAGGDASASDVTARNSSELWRVLAMAVLAVLLVEWFVAGRVRWHRPLFGGRVQA